MNKLQLLNTTIKTLNHTTNKIDLKLNQIKQKLANKTFNKNEYIQNYIKNFYNKFDDSFIQDDYLCRFNNFDFSKIDDSLKENLKEYMQGFHGLYYYKDDYQEGFTIDSFDNIYIDLKDTKTIFADCMKKSIDINNPDNDLELFLKLEKIQAENGIYPDIVYLSYYGNYSNDYEIPKEYTFLKTGQHNKEDRLLWFINQLISIYDDDIYHYYDNFIIEEFTPTFIKNIDNNLSIDINNVTLYDDFNLHIEFEIPTVLKEKDLKKLNIEKYQYTKYNTTIINIDTNIKNYLQTELNRGYSFDDLKKEVA